MRSAFGLCGSPVSWCLHAHVWDTLGVSGPGLSHSPFQTSEGSSVKAVPTAKASPILPA